MATIYAVFATGVMQWIGSRLTALYFKQQAVEANFRFDLARVREYSEQIALLKGETARSPMPARCSRTSSRRSSASSALRVRLIAFNQFYSQISVIMPYVIVAPFYFAKKVDFGAFFQAADAFGNVNIADELLRRPLHRPRRFQRHHLPSDLVRRRFRAHASGLERDAARRGAPGAGEALAIPDLDLNLPDGRKLARIGNLVLVPQEPTLVLGPERRRQIDAVPRHRRALALRQGRDRAARRTPS